MDRRCDFVIIGAGPAGCAAALQARQVGLSVIIIDSSTTLSRPRPGETLHPGIEPLFAQLGVLQRIQDAGFHRHRGVWVKWDGPIAFQAYGEDGHGPWRGFQADRSRLDALLLTAARDAGAEVFQACRAAGVLRNGQGLVAGLKTRGGSIRARWIADASGRRSWLANELGLKAEQHSPPLRVRFGWISGRDDIGDGEPSLQADPGGWHWRAPLGRDRCAWVHLRVVPADRTQMRQGPANSPGFKSGEGVDLHWRFLPECAGQGYFVLGDAAARLDPSSSHGVMRALMSGIFATHLVTAVKGKSIEPCGAALIYRDWMRAQFTHDTAALRELWNRHPSEAVRREMTNSSNEPLRNG